jgi:hypothetical protein
MFKYGKLITQISINLAIMPPSALRILQSAMADARESSDSEEGARVFEAGERCIEDYLKEVHGL